MPVKSNIRNLQTQKVSYVVPVLTDRLLNLKKSETHAASDPKEKTACKKMIKYPHMLKLILYTKDVSCPAVFS